MKRHSSQKIIPKMRGYGVRRTTSAHTSKTTEDAGSGTALGFSVLVVVGLLAFAIVCGANYLASISRTRTVAEQTALSSAYAVQLSMLGSDATDSGSQKSKQTAVCDQAFTRLKGKGMVLEECVLDGESVQVKISNQPSLKFLPRTAVSARAGPVDCVPQNR